MAKLLLWEKNWLRACGWSSERIQATKAQDDDIPVAYLCQKAPFLDLTLKVNRHTLIPRLETEQLFTLAKEDLLSLATKAQKEHIIATDIGTGSGALAIATARLLREHHLKLKVLASDISEQALTVAKENANFNQVSDYLLFAQSDLLASLIPQLPHTDYLLFANLPYIPDEQIKHLPKSVKNYEPKSALAGGKDGFRLIAKLLEQVMDLKAKPVKIYLEIDPSQTQFFAEPEPIASLYRWRIIKDFNQYQRFAIGELN